MLPLSYIVNVNITRETQTVTQEGFGTPLILGVNGSFGGDRVRSYADIDEVLADFASSSAEYKAAVAIFDQDPNPGIVKIAVSAARVNQAVTIVFSADIITGNTISVTVEGTVITQAFSVSNAATLTALAAQIAAIDGIGSCGSDGSHTLTLSAENTGIPYLVESGSVTGGASQATVTITTTVDNHGSAEDLAEISNEDDDWYGLIWTERTLAYVKYMADIIQTKRKIFITASNDANILDDTNNTDICSYLKANNYTRSAAIYNADPTKFIDAGWMSQCFTFDPGTENWAFKTIIGAEADSLTTNEVTNVIDPNTGKNGNVYVIRGGIAHTEFGNCGQGYIDQTRYIDLVTARIEEGIFGLLTSEPKVPYDDGGFETIANQVRGVLQAGEDARAITANPKWTVTVPSAVTANVSDRGHRIMRNLSFQFRLGDAVNQVIVNGRVSV